MGQCIDDVGAFRLLGFVDLFWPKELSASCNEQFDKRPPEGNEANIGCVVWRRHEALAVNGKQLASGSDRESTRCLLDAFNDMRGSQHKGMAVNLDEQTTSDSLRPVALMRKHGKNRANYPDDLGGGAGQIE